MKYIFFVGTAGSGKSTLVGAYKQWLDDEGVDSIVVNLDPGVDALPYSADVDIREWINLEETMREYGLGPNGAQIVAADLMIANISKMTDIIDTYGSEYVLVDTPGQLELFAFRESSQLIVRAFGAEDSMIVYLSDPSLCRTPNGFISAMVLGALVEFRMQLPTLNVLSKCDTLSDDDEQRTFWIPTTSPRPSSGWSCSRPSRTQECSARSGRSRPRRARVSRRSTPHPS